MASRQRVGERQYSFGHCLIRAVEDEFPEGELGRFERVWRHGSQPFLLSHAAHNIAGLPKNEP